MSIRYITMEMVEYKRSHCQKYDEMVKKVCLSHRMRNKAW